jgi:protein-tyrosine phosphatase
MFDANEIVPGLWQGSKPPVGVIVKSRGFTHLVLCARELQLPKEMFPGVQVIHAPNDDHPDYGPLDREKLKTAVVAARQVAEAIRNGGKALVTCAAGLNRSGLVSALAMHFLYGWSGDQCVDRVRKKRKPKCGYRALTNNEFTEALRRLKPVPASQLVLG